ncbi:MAG TPA: D-aminoacyl-tRNA deacylase [Polyangiaceae bacterium]
MRAVVQRVLRAAVSIEGGEEVGRIGPGLCALVGVERGDLAADAVSLASKIVGLRVFDDGEGRMNRDVLETGGHVLAVSQFTLLGDVRRGKRPSFGDAMDPEPARALFDRFCEECRSLGATVATGRFRAHMVVELLNDGPVTLLVDTKKAF